MLVYRLYTYDVWGNEDDGFQVNDVFRTDATLTIPDTATNDVIACVVSDMLGYSPLTVAPYDNDRIIYLENADNLKPVCELRKEGAK